MSFKQRKGSVITMKQNKTGAAITRKSGRKNWFRALPLGIGVGLAVWLGLLILSSYLLAGTEDPGTLILPAVFVLAAVSSLTAGFCVGKLSGSGALVSGLVTGGTLILLVTALSLLCRTDGETEMSLALKGLVCADFLLFSFTGALLCAPGGRKRRHTVNNVKKL